ENEEIAPGRVAVFVDRDGLTASLAIEARRRQSLEAEPAGLVGHRFTRSDELVPAEDEAGTSCPHPEDDGLGDGAPRVRVEHLTADDGGASGCQEEQQEQGGQPASLSHTRSRTVVRPPRAPAESPSRTAAAR